MTDLTPLLLPALTSLAINYLLLLTADSCPCLHQAEVPFGCLDQTLLWELFYVVKLYVCTTSFSAIFYVFKLLFCGVFD